MEFAFPRELIYSTGFPEVSQVLGGEGEGDLASGQTSLGQKSLKNLCGHQKKEKRWRRVKRECVNAWKIYNKMFGSSKKWEADKKQKSTWRGSRVNVREMKEKLCQELEGVKKLKDFDDLLKEKLSKEVSSDVLHAKMKDLVDQWSKREVSIYEAMNPKLRKVRRGGRRGISIIRNSKRCVSGEKLPSSPQAGSNESISSQENQGSRNRTTKVPYHQGKWVPQVEKKGYLHLWDRIEEGHRYQMGMRQMKSNWDYRCWDCTCL